MKYHRGKRDSVFDYTELCTKSDLFMSTFSYWASRDCFIISLNRVHSSPEIA